MIHESEEVTEEASDLRERLLVAEKVMRSLFDRNKQLEDQLDDGQPAKET